jgi:hypothetical protein
LIVTARSCAYGAGHTVSLHSKFTMGGISMTRRIIDLLLSWTGLVVAIVLLAMGGLLLWAARS